MARRNVPHVDKSRPLEFREAIVAWESMINELGIPTIPMDPAEYDTVGKVRRREGCQECLTCGGARFVRFTWPTHHPYFGRSVKCPNCDE